MTHLGMTSREIIFPVILILSERGGFFTGNGEVIRALSECPAKHGNNKSGD